jgi:membrane associated rhomboid family serine protease
MTTAAGRIRLKHLVAPVTLALILLTAATYLGQVWVGGDAVRRAFGLIPVRVSSLSLLMVLGDGQRVPAWLTLFTYVFPHAGWWHVTMNMAGLWFLGQAAEPVFGSKRFAFAYFSSGVLTGLTIVLIQPSRTEPGGGASGAICGTLGAFLALGLSSAHVASRLNAVILAVEAACLLGVSAWFLNRTPTPIPDRTSALMWHLIPFMAGWFYVRCFPTNWHQRRLETNR